MWYRAQPGQKRISNITLLLPFSVVRINNQSLHASSIDYSHETRVQLLLSQHYGKTRLCALVTMTQIYALEWERLD